MKPSGGVAKEEKMTAPTRFHYVVTLIFLWVYPPSLMVHILAGYYQEASVGAAAFNFILTAWWGCRFAIHMIGTGEENG